MFNMIVDFWFPFSFCFIFPLATSIFSRSEFWFYSSNTTDSSSLFNIKYIGEKMQWFPSTWFFNYCLGHSQTRTVISYFLWSINHIILKNIFNFLLVTILTIMLIYLFNVIFKMCLKRTLFLNDWSIPIVFMWYLRCGDCGIPLSTKHSCSNVSMNRIESIALVIILDLTQLVAWEDLLLIWKHK